ncbi:hypothetical protein PICMEDRAFT_34357 [Pichia membranifaciens NRRL Y-2026]|uniref:Secreted beta-glucosidase adg3 n=1 Tax=Pichia membranifaciens NRRL Y-2026 TaxID=763406 RepID=A0A1E3NII1_9ASCO|nr:hypothetical protein PICMEDRAFT_34357 [Pichia membranifaciens NRRL Y-2026]ODQ45939.1 hypothetical protein PICMEDRAFT_34357 [Pichia membranifaciens NRRL Y-2026]
MLSIKSLSLIILSTLVSESVSAPTSLHEKRDGGNTCSFPNSDGMVAVFNTKVANSEGWAQDGPCKANSYCQYACQPGYLMGQWNPDVTSYSYPGSQDGGLHCDSNGQLSKPISNSDYCVKGKGTAKAVNKAGDKVAFCQTVLPGNEAMLIPTEVAGGSDNDLAVPGTDYWASTASHFYVNPPGVSAQDGCVWGSTDKAQGNWAPYVAGFNMDDSGNTFAKIGWNPVYFEGSSPFSNTKPSYGIRLKCDDPSKCNGDTCEINPSKYGLNKMSNQQQSNSDGAAWCVVTATGNSGVSVEVFDV